MTIILLLGFVLGVWSAALPLMVLLARSRPGLIGTAERSPATARGLNEKRASLSGIACEYRRLLAVAAVGCHLLGDFGSNRFGFVRLLGSRL